jgi:putative sigma-54 modulation protein
MNTQIQAIHFKADRKLQDYISKKLEKLETFYSGIIDAQVYLKVENTSVKENKTIEIKLNAKQNSFIQTITSQSFEASADLAIESLKKAIKRYKGRIDAVSA